MLRAVKLLSPFMLIFLLIGCGGESDLGIMNTASTDPVGLATAAKAIPEGASITSATLHLYVDEASDQRIDVHRVTAPWDDATVTWNSLGDSYVPGIETSFMADAMGWKLIDLTALVQGWIAGDYANYGLLLKQVELNNPRTIFWATEGDYPPFLEVCYMEAGSEMCEPIAPLGDVFISEHSPDSNFSVSIPWLLLTGRYTETDQEKMSLIQFELPTTPPEGGCTATIGYWKNWTGLGNGNQSDMVTPLLPIWLGNEMGQRSLYVNNVHMAVDVLKMKTYGNPSNGITKLYAQLLAAKLNIARGASYGVVADVIDKADAFLATHRARAWNRLSDERQDRILRWKTILDNYNNGLIGPGHCGGMDDDD